MGQEEAMKKVKLEIWNVTDLEKMQASTSLTCNPHSNLKID